MMKKCRLIVVPLLIVLAAGVLPATKAGAKEDKTAERRLLYVHR
jgi:hypothetical protein